MVALDHDLLAMQASPKSGFHRAIGLSPLFHWKLRVKKFIPGINFSWPEIFAERMRKADIAFLQARDTASPDL